MNALVHPPAVRTTCPYCGVGCGVIAKPDGFGGASIEGDPSHPANFGRLCSKGSALGETLSLDGRLLSPLMRSGVGALEAATWDAALDRVARGFQDVIDRHGPDAVAFYVSGQLLTEDYYVANKLMKGFIGSGNIDTNSRLCMASSVAGHKRAFGSDTVPGCYEDLDEADLLVLVGSNAAWCHPVLYQRMIRNRRERGAKIVVIDPRATATSEDCDLLLRIAPGTDSLLFAGLFAHLAETNILDRAFIRDHTSGYAEALARARHMAPDIDTVAERCGLERAAVVLMFEWWRTTPATVTLYSQGVNQSAQGTDKVNAILNCHLATGRIGRSGMGPFSLTGQPNAMGGREVGGLANQLAAHMGFEPESVDRLRRFWNAPRVARAPGLKAVDMFEAIAAGRIKALWVMATNPAVSLPRADAVRAALANLELMVVSDVVSNTDTIAAGAHVVLPAAAWGEKDGTVTNSERRISRQRAFLSAPASVRPDWWIICEVARRMGFAAEFGFQSPAEIFREHAKLSAFENGGGRDFDLSGLAEVSEGSFAHLPPVQWPLRGGESRGDERLFADGGFFTPDRRARFVAIEDPALVSRPDGRFPLLLNTGRVRDHWHTMTRTGKSPRLSVHIEEPFVSVHPDDARRSGVAADGYARVTTVNGSTVLKVDVTEAQRPGEIFAPIHWSAAVASDGRIGALVQPATDEHSGQPELKATPATLSHVAYATRGFLLLRSDRPMPPALQWTRVAVSGGLGYRLAGVHGCESWSGLSRELLGTDRPLIEYNDPAQKRYRAAVIVDGRLDGCLFLAEDQAALPGWEWLKSQLAAATLTDAARRALLAGRSPEGAEDHGPVVCACFGVGRNRICSAVVKGEARSAEDIGRVLKAGTNCGSCLPELRRLVTASAEKTPAVAVG